MKFHLVAVTRTGTQNAVYILIYKHVQNTHRVRVHIRQSAMHAKSKFTGADEGSINSNMEYVLISRSINKNSDTKKRGKRVIERTHRNRMEIDDVFAYITDFRVVNMNVSHKIFNKINILISYEW